MKVVQINSTCGIGSTGKIAISISNLLDKNKIENHIIYGSKSNGFFNGRGLCDSTYIRMQSIKSHILGNYGFNSSLATKKAISILDEINPDIVHIHNIHSHDFNFKSLLQYLKENKKIVIWTFHDCWAFTGYCTYFTYCNCEKWKDKCKKCPQRKNYSLFFDQSKRLFELKKKEIDGLSLTIVSPSEWLASIVKQSFLKNYPIEVINNGINLEVFKPEASQLRNRYSIPMNKKIILGVSSFWEKRKGIDVFIELANCLNPELFQIVLIGTDNRVDKKLPHNIISIHRTQNQQELAGFYSASDVFVNPTMEENYPTVNMEAIACGTPVVTYNTGGSSEMIDTETGIVVNTNNIEELKKGIMDVCYNTHYSAINFREKAKAFDEQKCFEKYIELYKREINKQVFTIN